MMIFLKAITDSCFSKKVMPQRLAIGLHIINSNIIRQGGRWLESTLFKWKILEIVDKTNFKNVTKWPLYRPKLPYYNV